MQVRPSRPPRVDYTAAGTEARAYRTIAAAVGIVAALFAGCSITSKASDTSAPIDPMRAAAACMARPYVRSCYERAAVSFLVPLLSGPRISTFAQRTCISKAQAAYLSDADLESLVAAIARGDRAGPVQVAIDLGQQPGGVPALINKCEHAK